MIEGSANTLQATYLKIADLSQKTSPFLISAVNYYCLTLSSTRTEIMQVEPANYG